MVELFVRMLSAAAVSAWSWLFAPAYSQTVLIVSAGFAAYSVLSFTLERRNLRNAGASGLVAVADAISIGIALGAIGRLESLGFLVLAPCAYAAARYGALPSAMAPLAATALLIGQVLFFPGQDPSATLYAQMAGVLAVGLLLNHRRIVVSESIPIEVMPIEAIVEDPPPDAFMELRENYRRLRDHYRDLSDKSRRDRHAVEVYGVLFDEEGGTIRTLSSRLREITGADGVLLFRLSKFEDALIVRDFDGTVPDSLASHAMTVETEQAGSSIKASTERSLRALLDEETRSQMANVPLRRQGRLEGMLTLLADPDRLSGVIETAEEVAPYVAMALHEADRWQSCARRAQRAELMYELANVSSGSTTPNHLAARTVDMLARILEPERLSVSWLDGSKALLAANFGPALDVLAELSFGGGGGIAAWASMGGPEVWIPEALEDSRIRREMALSKRVRSLVVIPIHVDAEPFGYLASSSSRSRAIDAETVETLRLACANLGQALCRLEKDDLTVEGLVTPHEFQLAVTESRSAAIVTLEPLRRDSLIERFGIPTYEQALRQYSLQLRSRLPRGGCIRRQPEGGYLVLLPETGRELAQSWANEVAAMASFIGLSVDGTNGRVPLAFRARVGERNSAEVEA